MHLFGVFFYACLWHCFWGASDTNFVRFGVISRSILWSFCVFVGDAAKLQKWNTSLAKCLFLEVLGRPFYIIFANFSKFFLCCSQGDIFEQISLILASEGVHVRVHFLRFCRFCMKKNVLKLRLGR